MSDFVDSIFKDYKGDVQMYFFNALNEITGAKDLKLVTNKTAIDTALGGTGKEILAKSKEINSGEIKYFSTSGGEAALQEISKHKPNKKNLVDPEVEQHVLDFAYQQPAYGQLRVSNELKKQGIFVSSSGVKSIWL